MVRMSLVALSVVVLAGLGLLAATPTAAAEQGQPIRRITWFSHPYCWSMSGDNVPAGADPELWAACLAWERSNHKKYLELISNMKPDDAAIIYPIGGSAPMVELQQHAKATLGDRCLIVSRGGKNPDFLKNIKDPIRRFLSGEDLPGKKQFVHAMLTDNGKLPEPPGLADQIETEVRQACESIGYDWRWQALEVIYFNRMIAYEIETKFRQRKLVYDPKTVQCVAVGEGFEQCAMTWKSMLPGYLGLANPIENDPTLSVTGEPCVVFGKFKERIALPNDVRIFLWESKDGEAVALIVRAAFRWSDPLTFATISLEDLNLEVSKVEVNQIRDKRANQISTITLGPRFDPSPAFQPDGDHLRVPVYTGSRRGADHAYYIVAPGVDYAAFRQRLVEAEIAPAPRSR